MQRPVSKATHDVLDGFDVTEDAGKREMSQALRSFFDDSYDGRITQHDKMNADSLLLHSDTSASSLHPEPARYIAVSFFWNSAISFVWSAFIFSAIAFT